MNTKITSCPRWLQRIVGLRRSTPKQDEAPKEPSVPDIMEALQSDAFKRAPIGSQITLHGVTMTVMRHRKYREGFYGAYASLPTVWPAVLCEYRDANGIIREYKFSHSEFSFLPNVKDEP